MSGMFWVCVVLAVVAHNFSSAAAEASYERSIIVQGKVVCEDCQKSLYGSGTITTSQTPLQGAFVSVNCFNEAKEVRKHVVGRSSRRGTFSIKLKGNERQIAWKSCKVSLISSPTTRCNVKRHVQFDVNGSTPILFNQDKLVLLTGPLVFKPYYC